MTLPRRTALALGGAALAFTLIPGSATAQPPSAAREAVAAAGWSQVFYDTFDRRRPAGPKSDATRWTNLGREDTPVGKCVATIADPTQASDRVLHVRPRQFDSGTGPRCRFTTSAFFGDGADLGKTYKFSARIKLPTTRGHYPSFWTNGSAGRPYNEIDIVESFGKLNRPQQTGCTPGANQTSNTNVFRGVQSNYYSNDAHAGRRHCWTGDQMRTFRPFDGWHVFSVVWNPDDQLIFKIDGRRVARFGAAYAKPGGMNLILTDIDGDGSNAAQRGMLVDWVKAEVKG